MMTCSVVGRSKYSVYRSSKFDKAAPLESGRKTNKDLKWDFKKEKKKKEKLFLLYSLWQCTVSACDLLKKSF